MESKWSYSAVRRNVMVTMKGLRVKVQVKVRSCQVMSGHNISLHIACSAYRTVGMKEDNGDYSKSL